VKRWFLKNPALLNQVKNSVAKNYPDLRIDETSERIILRGSFPVSANGTVVDRFQIEVEFPDNYPDGIPTVREVGGRIPHHSDRHVIVKTKSACLFLREESSKYYPPGTTILDFLSGPVNDYFLWQTEFELTGQPTVKARQHGIDGIIEFYKEELEIEDPKAILNCIDYLRKEAKGHWPCFCGGGKKLRECHMEKFVALRIKVSLKVAEQFFEDFEKVTAPKKKSL